MELVVFAPLLEGGMLVCLPAKDGSSPRGSSYRSSNRFCYYQLVEFGACVRVHVRSDRVPMGPYIRPAFARCCV